MNKKFISFVKLACIIYLVIFIPKIISEKDSDKQPINETKYIASIDNLIKNKKSFRWLRQHRIALIGDLKEKKNQLKTIASLEKNGFRINKMFFVTNSLKPLSQKFPEIQKTNIPVFKWDNQNILSKFNEVDSIIFNVKNNGLKTDKCFNTLLNIMTANQQLKKNIIILDQPNPLSNKIQGIGKIPLQHGLTAGELAKYFNKYKLSQPTKLSIITMTGFNRQNQDISSRELLKILNKIEPINYSIKKKLSKQALILPKNSLSNWEINHLEKLCSKLGLNCRKTNDFKQQKDLNKLNMTEIDFDGIQIDKKTKNTSFSNLNALLTITNFLKNRKKINLKYSDNFTNVLGLKNIKDFLEDKINFNQLKAKSSKNLQRYFLETRNLIIYKPYPQIREIEITKLT